MESGGLTAFIYCYKTKLSYQLSQYLSSDISFAHNVALCLQLKWPICIVFSGYYIKVQQGTPQIP